MKSKVKILIAVILLVVVAASFLYPRMQAISAIKNKTRAELLNTK